MEAGGGAEQPAAARHLSAAPGTGPASTRGGPAEQPGGACGSAGRAAAGRAAGGGGGGDPSALRGSRASPPGHERGELRLQRAPGGGGLRAPGGAGPPRP